MLASIGSPGQAYGEKVFAELAKATSQTVHFVALCKKILNGPTVMLKGPRHFHWFPVRWLSYVFRGLGLSSLQCALHSSSPLALILHDSP